MRALWPTALLGTVAGVVVALGLTTTPAAFDGEGRVLTEAGPAPANRVVTTHTGGSLESEPEIESDQGSGVEPLQHAPAAFQPFTTPDEAPLRPLDIEGPQTMEEVPAWRDEQRLRMQGELAEQMGERMRSDGVPAERIDSMMEAGFAQRDLLEAGGD